MSDRLNTIEETGPKIRAGRTKVFGLIKSGELASVRVGGRRYVTDEQIAEFIERQKRESDNGR